MKVLKEQSTRETSINWNMIDLYNANLSDADLNGVNLHGANLRGTDLNGANLSDADLNGVNLHGANLSNADLNGANLYNADLSDADLGDANLDFSCWPLWCGSLNVKVNIGIVRQLAYHFCCLKNSSKKYKAARKALLPLANQFHRIPEVPKLED